MFAKENNREFTNNLVKFYEGLGENQLRMMKIIFFVSPLLWILIIDLFNFSFVIKFILFVIFISLMALVYSIYILIWIMKSDAGTVEMQRIANSITEGSEGFFRAQYGTISKLSFVFALLIMLLYYTRDSENEAINQVISNKAMALLTGISFMFGAACSAFSGYAGMWVSVRTNIR
jgi:Na+/H+-translocating membrane pyrophosphatase